MTSIEELTPEHFQLVSGWLSDPEINQWLTWDWRSRVATAALIAMMVRNKRNRAFLVRCDGRACGLTALADIDVVDRTAMVWYVLGDATLSGRGIMTAALVKMASVCFREMDLASLYAWIMEGNASSKRVLQKAGFREAGRIRDAASFEGRQVDRIYFDMTAAEVSNMPQISRERARDIPDTPTN